MSTNFKKLIKNRDFVLFISCFFMLLVRYFWRGIAYYPQLDDYIQYYDYRHFYSSLGEAISSLGLLKARPFAGIMDIAFWSSFWDNMWISVVLISLMYAASGIILKKVFKKYFNVSNFFVILYGLAPFGFEAFYWLSAASRIVVGMFLASVSLWLYQKFIEKGKWAQLILAVLFQFASFGFYEQVMVFSITATLLMGIYHVFKKEKRGYFTLLTFLSVAMLFAVTKLQSASTLYDSRMSLVLPFTGQGFTENLVRALKQYAYILKGAAEITAKGFVNGLKLAVKYMAFIPVLLAGVLTYVIAAKCRGEQKKEKGKGRLILGLVCGFLLFLAPMTPFFILKDSYIPMRNMAISLCGAALMADILLTAVLPKKYMDGAICAAALIVFTFAGFSELDTYKMSHEKDTQAAEAIASEEIGEKTAVIGLEEYWDEDQIFKYKEHVYSTCSSDWALTGMVRCYKNDPNVPLIMPISEKTPYMSWSREIKDLSAFDTIYHYRDGQLKKLEKVQTGEYSYELYTDGELYAEMTDNDGMGVFTLYER